MIDAVGNPAIANAALPLIKMGGSVCIYGVIGDPEFVLEKFDAGQSVAEAQAELAVIEAGEKDEKIVALEAKIAELSAAIVDKDAKLAKALSAEYGVEFAAAGTLAPAPKSQDPWDNDENLRREFGGDKEVYEAYLRQESDGAVFIQGVNSLSHTS